MPRRRSTRVGAGIVASSWLVLLLALAPPAGAQSSSPEGIWNLEMRNLAQRATGGVQNKLLRIERVDGELRGELTSPRNDFLEVDEFTLDDGRIHFYFGAYEYALEVEGDRMSGVMRSPVDTLQVDAVRQETVLYTGDEPESWVTTRTGVLGHRSELAPPDDAADPNGWVRSRAESLDDLVLVLRGVPVSFANAEAFEDDLWRLAGRRVDIVGAWEGERLRIDEVSAARDEDGR
ncbi:MAG: hypothetical protein R3223_09775 [Longimicrobiales bacterium]|nr:hypothetical protein [Longimicrobiales bacterium]